MRIINWIGYFIVNFVVFTLYCLHFFRAGGLYYDYRRLGFRSHDFEVNWNMLPQYCPCAFDDDPSTSRLHIKIYQYRKPIRSHSRLRHSNMRLIDAKMVTWDSARWVSLHVTDAVKRIMTRGRRNGGFEVHVRNMEEEVLDAKTVIDPTVCTSVSDSECTHEYSPLDDEFEEQDDPNYSPVLEITTTTTSRIDIS